MAQVWSDQEIASQTFHVRSENYYKAIGVALTKM